MVLSLVRSQLRIPAILHGFEFVAPMHKFLRLAARASPRAFARKTRPDGHAVKQVVCETCAWVPITLCCVLDLESKMVNGSDSDTHRL